MSLEKTLIDAGAHCVAGHLILDRKLMGSYTDGAFVASEHGLEFEVTAPAAITPAEAKQAKKGKAPKVAEPADEPDGDITDLDALLGE